MSTTVYIAYRTWLLIRSYQLRGAALPERVRIYHTRRDCRTFRRRPEAWRADYTGPINTPHPIELDQLRQWGFTLCAYCAQEEQEE